jgi:DNA-binding CsgD family transcriptional regulator
MIADREDDHVRRASERQRQCNGYDQIDCVSFVHQAPTCIDRSATAPATRSAGGQWPAPPHVNAMTGAAGAAPGERGETPDFADFISGRMISPAGYIGTTPTALIGRANDLERLAAVLDAPDAGLVAVTGPAGVGKSRLVMEFFRHHLPDPGGAVEVLDFGQLADVSVCRLMLKQLKEHCKEGSPSVRAVLERLGAGKHTVLLDHFEDVADELAPLLAEFRRRCPQVRIISVGTTRLGLYGERVVRLRPLPAGNTVEADPSAVAQIPAVELFVQCARSVRPEFKLTAENSRAVVSLCQLLGGLPYAIELAASQVKLAEPELILERSKHGLGDLRRIDHHPYSRHSSISDIVSWVFDHLYADERMLLNKLAIFESPFTLRAAAEVVDGSGGALYRTVERLIDKSALIPDQRHAGELTLSIPNVVRLATIRSLAGRPVYPALRRAHGEYFLAVAGGRTGREPAVAATGGGAGPGPDTRADLLAALGYWREAGDGQAMAAIANALRERCTGAGQARQCLRLTEEVLRAGVGDPRLRARTLEGAGEMAMRLGSAAARGHLGRARDAYLAVRDGDGLVRCLRLLGDEAYAAGDLDLARRRYEEGLATPAAPGEDAGAGDTAAPSRAMTARSHLTRRLAVALREAGDLDRAGELARSALAVELDRKDVVGAVLARYVLATIGWLEHDSGEARALFADAAKQVGGLPDAPERPECLEILAITLWKWRRITDWRRLTAALGLADRLRRRQGPRRPRPLNKLIKPILAAASQELTAEEYARAWRAGTEAELSWAAALRLVPGSEPAAGAGPEVPTDVAELLTKRELEVALLVAKGLTNRVVAHQLGIAEWTVVNHLRKVMRKLGCQSRVHVTRRMGIR